MVRGRTSLTGGYMVLGHEITGEVVETGADVEFIKNGDLCSVPFNIACGRCPACKRGDTGVCLNVNPARAGAAYGYVDMGGWIGGQARSKGFYANKHHSHSDPIATTRQPHGNPTATPRQPHGNPIVTTHSNHTATAPRAPSRARRGLQAEYVMVPYADFNLLKFPDKDRAMEKIADLTLLSDIFPTGFHGAVQAHVEPTPIIIVPPWAHQHRPTMAPPASSHHGPIRIP